MKTAYSPQLSHIRRQGLACVVLLCMAVVNPAVAEPPNGAGSYEDLLELFAEYQAWKSPDAVDGVVDYGPAAIERRRDEIRAMQRRMDDMGVARWSVPQQVDFLTVRAELDQQEFILHVTRPWSRDPLFYVTGVVPIAFTDLPVSGDEQQVLRQELRSVPLLLEGARSNLTEVAGDYADRAIFMLTHSDGIGGGLDPCTAPCPAADAAPYPRRETMPPGFIGWYEDLLQRADAQPELRADIMDALSALREFHEWLVDNREDMTALNGVGKEAFDWFVKYGLLLPYTSEEMALLSQRELDRLWGFYALERHRNRELPELELSESAEEYHRRLADTDRLVRDRLVDEAIITVPEYIPGDWQVMGFNVPFVVRETPPNFWEQVQYRDPSPDHLHAVIPGHRFDDMVASRIDHPIRSQVNFGARWQGWAVYLEEGPLQLGVFEARPRTRELIYLFGLWRAARSLGDIYNQWNEFNAAETAQYWMEVTPLMDPDVARNYSHLRPAPGHGLEYTIGNIQMFRLLAERKRQLREEFVLRQFHDEFISKGRIPIAAIHYEMTGDADAVAPFWNRTPLSSVELVAPATSD